MLSLGKGMGMKRGLLWFDDDSKRGLADKVLAAAERYRARVGRWPDRCLVHPAMLGASLSPPGARVKEVVVSRNGCRVVVATGAYVLLHHLWIGEERDEVEDQAVAVAGPSVAGGAAGGVVAAGVRPVVDDHSSELDGGSGGVEMKSLPQRAQRPQR